MPTTAKRNSWMMNVLAVLAVASGIGYLAMACFVSRWLTRATRKIALRPDGDDGCTWQEISCRTSDGLLLVGWVITPPEPHATMALFHGLRSNRERTLKRIAFLTRAGYRCVAFDHRAHGQSEGKATTFGFNEGRDVAAVAEFIRRAWPDEPCAALGTSMGAAAVCFAGRCGFDAVILESLYHNLAAAFSVRIGGEFPGWFRFFLGGVIWFSELRMGLRLVQIAPWQHIQNLAPTPVLLITGQDDSHAPPGDVQKLFECAGEPRELHIVPGAGHSNVCEMGGDRYEELILHFLRRHLRQRERLAA